MKKCMELEEKLKTMDREISVNPQYVQKVNTSNVVRNQSFFFYLKLYACCHCFQSITSENLATLCHLKTTLFNNNNDSLVHASLSGWNRPWRHIAAHSLLLPFGTMWTPIICSVAR